MSSTTPRVDRDLMFADRNTFGRFLGPEQTRNGFASGPYQHSRSRTGLQPPAVLKHEELVSKQGGLVGSWVTRIVVAPISLCKSSDSDRGAVGPADPWRRQRRSAIPQKRDWWWQ